MKFFLKNLLIASLFFSYAQVQAQALKVSKVDYNCEVAENEFDVEVLVGLSVDGDNKGSISLNGVVLGENLVVESSNNKDGIAQFYPFYASIYDGNAPVKFDEIETVLGASYLSDDREKELSFIVFLNKDNKESAKFIFIDGIVFGCK